MFHDVHTKLYADKLTGFWEAEQLTRTAYVIYSEFIIQ